MWDYVNRSLYNIIEKRRANTGGLGRVRLIYMINNRKCKKCNTEKPIYNFYRVRKDSNYYRYTCKECSLKEKLAWKKTEKGKEANMRYLRKRDKNKYKEYNREYIKKWKRLHPEETKILKAKSDSKRRNLGFIPINQKFQDSVAHHLDDKYIMYIPEKIHRKCSYPDRDIHRLLVLNELYIQNIIL